MSEAGQVYTDPRVQALAELPWPEIRKQAAQNYNVTIYKEMTKHDVLLAVERVLQTKDFASAVTDKNSAPAPGYSRIILGRRTGEKNRPKIKSVNGYKCGIPRGVQVDVPTKVYRSLLDETEVTLEPDPTKAVNDPDYWVRTIGPRENIQLLAQTPGPDPKPGHELVKERKLKPYRAFAEQFGYWPTDKELRAAVLAKQIEVNDPKFLAAVPSQN